jgi:hypothetical protein
MTEPIDFDSLPTEAKETVYEDYFGFEETRTWYFPDGKQYIQYKVMTEGDKAKFQRATNRDITLSRTSGDARIKADPAAERWALMEASVKGWHIFQNGHAVAFTIGSPSATFNQWLNNANPKFVEDLEFAIRKANPWLQADMSVEDIDKEMDRLREMRDQVTAADAAKVSSSGR